VNSSSIGTIQNGSKEASNTRMDTRSRKQERKEEPEPETGSEEEDQEELEEDQEDEQKEVLEEEWESGSEEEEEEVLDEDTLVDLGYAVGTNIFKDKPSVFTRRLPTTKLTLSQGVDTSNARCLLLVGLGPAD